MAEIYLHWKGTQIGKAGQLKKREEEIDRWFPRDKPDVGDDEEENLLATIAVNSEAEVFHKIYEIKQKVLGIDIKVGMDAFFKGTVEVWEIKPRA